MDTFCRWVARHIKAVRSVASVFLGAVIAMLILIFDLPYPLAFVLILVCSYVMLTVLYACGGRFQKRALAYMMEQCDPYPFLRELQTQLSYGYTPGYEAIMRLNLATALHNTGATGVALDVIKHIPIEKKGLARAITKALYYNNLATFLGETGDADGADAAYRKFRALADGKAMKVLSKYYPHLSTMAEAGQLFRHRDYGAALEKCRSVPLKTPYDQVENALFRARCSIGLGDHAAAREDLRIVIENGNKLAAVDKARELLKEL